MKRPRWQIDRYKAPKSDLPHNVAQARAMLIGHPKPDAVTARGWALAHHLREETAAALIREVLGR